MNAASVFNSFILLYRTPLVILISRVVASSCSYLTHIHVTQIFPGHMAMTLCGVSWCLIFPTDKLFHSYCDSCIKRIFSKEYFKHMILLGAGVKAVEKETYRKSGKPDEKKTHTWSHVTSYEVKTYGSTHFTW